MPSTRNQLSEPPSLSPEKAIALIQRQLERLSQIKRLPWDDPRVGAWESTTEEILNKTFGKPQGELHQRTKDAMYPFSGPVRLIGMTPGEHQSNHDNRSIKRKVLLEAVIEQLQDGVTPPVLATPNYQLHPEIEKVSGDLLRDGYFTQAALAAYIRVINEVKNRSGLTMDGDSLMNRAFGCENKQPVLAFNSLSTDAEHDEQRGILYLFKGIVSLRNAKAHSNVLFDDASRAHEYLALASLLMRLLEIAPPVR